MGVGGGGGGADAGAEVSTSAFSLSWGKRNLPLFQFSIWRRAVDIALRLSLLLWLLLQFDLKTS